MKPVSIIFYSFVGTFLSMAAYSLINIGSRKIMEHDEQKVHKEVKGFQDDRVEAKLDRIGF